MILFRAKKSSSHHSVHGIHGPQPKLAPIDVLQNVDDRKFISQNHQLMISKPEIAILCSTRNHHQQENDKKDISNGSSSGYGSGLMTPDVAKTNPNQNTIPNSNYHLTNGGPNSRVNLVTIAQHQRGNYTYNNFNYDVYNDDHINLNLPPPPPPGMARAPRHRLDDDGQVLGPVQADAEGLQPGEHGADLVGAGRRRLRGAPAGERPHGGPPHRNGDRGSRVTVRTI